MFKHKLNSPPSVATIHFNALINHESSLRTNITCHYQIILPFYEVVIGRPWIYVSSEMYSTISIVNAVKKTTNICKPIKAPLSGISKSHVLKITAIFRFGWHTQKFSVLRWIFYNIIWFIDNSPLKRSRQWSKHAGHALHRFVFVILYF